MLISVNYHSLVFRVRVRSQARELISGSGPCADPRHAPPASACFSFILFSFIFFFSMFIFFTQPWLWWARCVAQAGLCSSKARVKAARYYSQRTFSYFNGGDRGRCVTVRRRPAETGSRVTRAQLPGDASNVYRLPREGDATDESHELAAFGFCF